MAKQTIFSQAIKKQTMAEQMAETIQELILSGVLESEETLPTEPELAEQFGVSRAVVRDATRLLMARGLVEVQQGRGVFVTQPQNETFGGALLLALRRANATAWDVEQFEQIVFPEVIGLAATTASDEEVAATKRLAEKYVEVIVDHHGTWWQSEAPLHEQERLMAAFRQLMQTIFAVTHNQVFIQLAQPLLNLRNLRNWADAKDDTPEKAIDQESAYIHQLVGAIESRDPDRARATVARLMALPPEAIEAMRKTPVGEISTIPIPSPHRQI